MTSALNDLLSQGDIFDTSQEAPPDYQLDARVAGARVSDGLLPSRGTVLDGRLLSDEETDDFWTNKRSDGFSAGMHEPDVAGLTKANEGLASNALDAVKAATTDAAFGRAAQGPSSSSSPGRPPAATNAFTDPAMADALHMALEQGVESSVYLWAAQAQRSGSTPAVDPEDEIWSGAAVSHQAVQAEQAEGLLQDGQGWYSRIMTGDVYEGVWGNDPTDGIWTHQEILDAQAKALASGGQNWYRRVMEGDIFEGYRDSTTGDLIYSPADAREVSAKMAMFNADRARYGDVRNLLWEGNAPGSGFEVDTGY